MLKPSVSHVQGSSFHGKASIPDSVAALDGADSDASAGTDFEEENAVSQAGTPAVGRHAPVTLTAAQTASGTAGTGWKWSKKSA